MNRDEAQYFLPHIFNELLKSPGRKSTGNSKSNDQKTVGCWSNSLTPVLTKSIGVLETSTYSKHIFFDQ